MSTHSSPTTNFPETVVNSPSFTALSATTSILSMLGSIAIILTYFLWKEIRSTSRRILVYISIADFFTAAGNMIAVIGPPVSGSNELCKVQSFITAISNLCSFFWTTYLGLYLFLSFARRQFRLAENLMIVFHITAWGIPVSILTAALWKDKLGYAENLLTGGWCWINRKTSNSLLWMLITGKAWEIASYILITVFFAVVKCYIRKEIKNHQSFVTRRSLLAANKAERRLSFIPLVFILIRIWGTVRFFLYACFPDFAQDHNWQKKLSFLVYLQGIGDNAQGFANFLLYCFLTEKFQRHLKSAFYNRYCFRKPTKELEVTTTDKESSINVHFVDESSPLLDSVKRNGNIPRKPTVAGNIPRKPTIAGNIPRKPTIAGNIPRKPTIAGIIPRKPTINQISPAGRPNFTAFNKEAIISGQYQNRH